MLLQRMMKMVSLHTSSSARGCDYALVHLSRAVRFITMVTGEREPVGNIHILRRRPVNIRSQVRLKGKSMSICNLGPLNRSCSQHAVDTINDAANFSYRHFPGNINTGASAKHLNKAESSKSLSATQPLAVLHNEKLVKALVYEAHMGYINVVGKSKRFCDFLLEQITADAEKEHIGSGFKSQDFLLTLSQDAKLYDQMDKKQRINLLNRVAQSLGFTSLKDLVDHDRAVMEASQGLQGKMYMVEESSDNSSLNANTEIGVVTKGNQTEAQPRAILKHVPGIVYGSSSPIKLGDQGGESKSAVISNGSVGGPEVSKSVNSGRVKKKVVTAVEKQKKSVARFSERIKKSVARSATEVSPKAGFDDTTAWDSKDTEDLLSSTNFVIDENWGLDMPVASLKCLSAIQRARLEENGFNTLRLLLQHVPRMYQNFQQAGQRVEDGQNLSFVGIIVQSRGSKRGASLGLVEVIVRSEVDEVSLDDTASENMEIYEREGRTVFLHLKKFFKGSRYTSTWFLNMVANKYPENAQVTVCGKVKALPQHDHFEIREFNLELWDGSDRQKVGLESSPELPSSGKPYPVYPGKGGLQPRTIEFCIQRILPLLSPQLDPIPKDLRKKFQLQELHEAYIGIHSPAHTKDAEVARQRLVFDEFFYLQLGMLLPRQELADKCSVVSGIADLASVFQGGVLDMENWSPLTLKIVRSLPYNLTNSQIRAAGEVMWDLQRPVPMSRLLQGDVGCGKTVVAFLALIEVVDAGYQGALMAPTEFLATQHYQRFTSWLEELDESDRPRVALLTGSTPVSKARNIRSGLESGEIALAVGTHSLISDSVKFSALRLAVIDEQHRFGVSQRGRLNSKVGDAIQTLGSDITEEDDVAKLVSFGAPHILAMSATPIPRTLALAMHGDMSLSQITELPPGRADTATYAIHGDKKGRKEVYERVRKELEDGGRVFIIFPVIEESEEIPDVRAAETEFKNLELEFKDFNFGLVHGRMRSHEKEEAMKKFKDGDTQVLVSTTVVEVGIDIPEASMIVVEHAERYGMAQLHQLRGRVGRGSRESSCILLGSRASSLARLKVLETSRDGFYLAEIDLRHRGPGDMLGKRQSGYLPEFNLARLETDGDILERARRAAEELLQAHPKLEGLPRIRQELSMRRPPPSLS